MKRSRFKIIFALPLVALACFLIFILASTPLGIPNIAAETYGPASPNLSTIDQIYLSSLLMLEKNSLTSPTNPFGKEVSFQVALGESPLDIIDRLHNVDLINNPDSFRHYLIYSGLDTQIQAGEYTLSPIMSPIEIANSLRDPTPSDVDFIVLAGWRTEEIANSLATSGLNVSSDDFINAAQNPTAEGFLFPGLYTLPRETSAGFLVRTLLSAFHENVTSEMKDGYSQQGMTLEGAVILASIIQRESILEEEMPLIASVFFNRLKIGMKLEADPTVQYALGFNVSQGTWWTNPLSGADLRADSLYNTYLHTGLPPGPICNPGANALKAVAFPAQTPYYYFLLLAMDQGDTYSQKPLKTMSPTNVLSPYNNKFIDPLLVSLFRFSQLQLQLKSGILEVI